MTGAEQVPAKQDKASITKVLTIKTTDEMFNSPGQLAAAGERRGSSRGGGIGEWRPGSSHAETKRRSGLGECWKCLDKPLERRCLDGRVVSVHDVLDAIEGGLDLMADVAAVFLTHEVIDQVFAVISDYLRSTDDDVSTLPLL